MRFQYNTYLAMKVSRYQMCWNIKKIYIYWNIKTEKKYFKRESGWSVCNILSLYLYYHINKSTDSRWDDSNAKLPKNHSNANYCFNRTNKLILYSNASFVLNPKRGVWLHMTECTPKHLRHWMWTATPTIYHTLTVIINKLTTLRA